MLTANLDSDLSLPQRARQETRLFLSLEKGMDLLPSAVLSSREAVRMLNDRALKAGAERVFITATSALRDARDILPLTQGILADTGVKLQVLSGRQEAAYSFLGAVRPYGGEALLGVMDIGGGSTEVAVGSREALRHSFSLQLGASRLYGVCPIDDFTCLVPTLAQAERILDAGFEEIEPVPSRWLLVGGTGTALIGLLRGHFMDANDMRDQDFSLTEAAEALRKLSRLTLRERAALPGMTSGRERILPTGLAVLTTLMTRLDITSMTVTARNNTDGFLYTLYKNQR